MKALLLAAGEGTRLRPLTVDRPKAMVPVAGVPMVAYALRWLSENGITEVAINLHHRPDPLLRFVGDGSAFGLSVVYSREPQLLGSSGALVPLRSFFAGDDPFVVLYGDVLTDVQLDRVVAAHREWAADATIVLTRVEDPRRAGMVETDPSGWVRRFVEKPPRWDGSESWANAGIYVLGPRVWGFLPSGGFHDFGLHLFPSMLASGARVRGIRAEGLVLDVGSHERLARATALVEAGRVARPRAAA